MIKQRTHFDKAFKENAVKLSLERKNVSDSHTNWGYHLHYCIAGAKSIGNVGKEVSRATESVLVKPEGLQNWKNALKRLKQSVTY